MMEMFGLVEKDFSSVEGVSMEPGTFNVYPCYRLHKDALVSQPTKYVSTAKHCKTNQLFIVSQCENDVDLRYAVIVPGMIFS